MCERYYKKVTQYEYIQIDMRNPLLSQSAFLGLRDLLKKRRHCHKLFDRLKPDATMADLLTQCRFAWAEKHRGGESADEIRYRFEHLILRENVLLFTELLDLPYLAKKLEFLQDHISSKARTQGSMTALLCFECTAPITGSGPDSRASMAKADIFKARQCKGCSMYFHHRRLKGQGTAHTCLERHICAGVFENYIQRDVALEERALEAEYNSKDLDGGIDIGAMGEIEQEEQHRVIEIDTDEEESVDDGGAMFRQQRGESFSFDTRHGLDFHDSFAARDRTSSVAGGGFGYQSEYRKGPARPALDAHYDFGDDKSD